MDTPAAMTTEIDVPPDDLAPAAPPKGDVRVEPSFGHRAGSVSMASTHGDVDPLDPHPMPGGFPVSDGGGDGDDDDPR